MVESPFEDDDEPDSSVHFKTVAVDDVDDNKRTMPWESRLLRIISGLVVLLVVVVVLFAGLDGINGFTLLTPGSRDLVIKETKLVEKQMAKSQA